QVDVAAEYAVVGVDDAIVGIVQARLQKTRVRLSAAGAKQQSIYTQPFRSRILVLKPAAQLLAVEFTGHAGDLLIASLGELQEGLTGYLRIRAFQVAEEEQQVATDVLGIEFHDLARVFHRVGALERHAAKRVELALEDVAEDEIARRVLGIIDRQKTFDGDDL